MSERLIRKKLSHYEIVVEVLALKHNDLEPHGIGVVEAFGQDREGRFLAVAFPPITSVTQLEAIFHWQPETAR